MTEALGFALAALKALPGLIAAGADALAMIRHAKAAVAQMEAEARGPSDGEWAALNELIGALMAQLKD